MGSSAVHREGIANGGDLRTRDLLGSCWQWSKEVDLELEASPLPVGWEKRLDMKSGKVYFHNSCSAGKKRKAESLFQDLNFPQVAEVEDRRADGGDAASRPLEEHNFIGMLTSSAAAASGVAESIEDERNLGLKLPLPSGHVGSEWQSVCTLDKVKIALRRAEKESGKRKVSDPCCSTSSHRSADGSPSRGSSSSPAVNADSSSANGSEGETSLLAAGCPRCLLYVLLPKANPKCPRCGFLVLADSSPVPGKRPRWLPFEEDQSRPAETTAAAGARSPHLRHPFDLNTVSF